MQAKILGHTTELKKSFMEQLSVVQKTMEEKMEALFKKQENEGGQDKPREAADDEQRQDAQQPGAMQSQIDELKTMLVNLSKAQENTESQMRDQIAANQAETSK